MKICQKYVMLCHRQGPFFCTKYSSDEISKIHVSLHNIYIFGQHFIFINNFCAHLIIYLIYQKMHGFEIFQVFKLNSFLKLINIKF